jgi:hypothetical protein
LTPEMKIAGRAMPVLMMVKHDDSETARVGNNVWVVNCVDVL